MASQAATMEEVQVVHLPSEEVEKSQSELKRKERVYKRRKGDEPVGASLVPQTATHSRPSEEREKYSAQVTGLAMVQVLLSGRRRRSAEDVEGKVAMEADLELVKTESQVAQKRSAAAKGRKG